MKFSLLVASILIFGLANAAGQEKNTHHGPAYKPPSNPRNRRGTIRRQ